MAKTWDKKGIAISPGSQFHYMDHLAPIACIMDIPLLFLEETSFELAQHYYPFVQAQLEDNSLFSLEKLVKNYDVSFISEPWNREKFQQQLTFLEEQYHKKWQNVFCPHGFSDKGFYFDYCYTGSEVYLVYGLNMIDLLKQRGMWNPNNRYVMTGNYRYTFYRQNADFYNTIFQKEIACKFDQKRPTILYAPTWLDQEQSGAFEEGYSYILDRLPSEYNLIVKVHPRFELDEVVDFYRIIGQYETNKNILFLTDFPPIFPLLAHVDMYIGDMSSIGYDFLAFNKPLFLLNKHKRNSKTDRGLFLYRCATEIVPEQYPDIYDIIEKSLQTDTQKMSPLRKEMWDYTFGPARPLADIRADIITACEMEQQDRLSG